MQPRNLAARSRERRRRIAARGAGTRQSRVEAPRTRARERGRRPAQRAAAATRAPKTLAPLAPPFATRLSSRWTSAASASRPKVTNGASSTRMVSSGAASGASLAPCASSHALHNGADAHGGGWNAGGLASILMPRACGARLASRRCRLRRTGAAKSQRVCLPGPSSDAPASDADQAPVVRGRDRCAAGVPRGAPLGEAGRALQRGEVGAGRLLQGGGALPCAAAHAWRLLTRCLASFWPCFGAQKQVKRRKNFETSKASQERFRASQAQRAAAQGAAAAAAE